MAPSDNLLHHDRNAMAVVAGLVDAAAFGLIFLGLLGLSTGGQRTLRRRALLVDTAIVALATGFVAWELEQLAHLRELGCDESQGVPRRPADALRERAPRAVRPPDGIDRHLTEAAVHPSDQGCAGHAASASA